MAIISKIIDGMIYKGGFVAAGVACFVLAKTEVLPEGALSASYGMAVTGAVGLICRYVNCRGQRNNQIEVDLEANEQEVEDQEEEQQVTQQQREEEEVVVEVEQEEEVVVEVEQEEEEEEDDPDYEARMAEFNEVRPILERHIEEQNELYVEYLRIKRRFKIIDEMERNSRSFENIIAEFERRYEGRLVTVKNAIDRLATVEKVGYRQRRGTSFDIKILSKLSRYYFVF